MPQYQEQKKTEVKKAPPVPKTAGETAGETIREKVCPNCGASMLEEALFCPECGLDPNQPSFCPNCGAKTNPGADICVECKSWLLDGQCKFCYTALAPDAEFCPECGNPKDGVKCPHCGTLSIFDFCTTCGKPLTEGAHLALELAKKDPDAKAIVESVAQTVTIEAELAKLKEIISSAPPPAATAPPPPKKERFSASKIAAVLQTEVNMDAAAARREEEQRKEQEFARLQEEHKRENEIREAEAKIRELEKQKKEALDAAAAARDRFKHKQFLTNQEARRFHNASRPSGCKGWLCNFTNTVHPDGPNGCDEPRHGGVWYDGDVVMVQTSGPS
jgi:hypothetical protein